jgi:hypothetical protein
VLIGAASHLFWDSFTHTYTFFVDRYEILRKEVWLFGVHTYRYRIIQHVSTAVGGGVIAYAIWKLPVNSLSPRRSQTAYWPLVFVLTLIFFGIRLLLTKVWIGPAFFVVTFISSGIIALILAPLLLKKKKTV